MLEYSQVKVFLSNISSDLINENCIKTNSKLNDDNELLMKCAIKISKIIHYRPLCVVHSSAQLLLRVRGIIVMLVFAVNYGRLKYLLCLTVSFKRHDKIVTQLNCG